DWNASDSRPALHLRSYRNDSHRRCIDVLPSPLAGPDCGALLDARRETLLMSPTTVEQPKPGQQFPKPTDPADLLPKKLAHARPLFDPEILKRATRDSFIKLNPVTLLKNPVIFVVEVGAVITTVFLIRDVVTGAAGIGFPIQ